jgi:hypothetical protein
MTPLLIRTSGRRIFALKPLDPTNVPEELVTNCIGSPAAEVMLVDEVEFDDELFWPNTWISGE